MVNFSRHKGDVRVIRKGLPGSNLYTGKRTLSVAPYRGTDLRIMKISDEALDALLKEEDDTHTSHV